MNSKWFELAGDIVLGVICPLMIAAAVIVLILDAIKQVA